MEFYVCTSKTPMSDTMAVSNAMSVLLVKSPNSTSDFFLQSFSSVNISAFISDFNLPIDLHETFKMVYPDIDPELVSKAMLQDGCRLRLEFESFCSTRWYDVDSRGR